MTRRSTRVEWTWRSIVLLVVFLLLTWLLREFAGIDLIGGGEVTDTVTSEWIAVTDQPMAAPQALPGVTDTVTSEWIAVYFTTPRYPDDPALRTGGVDLHLVNVIDQAQKRVDVAAYELNLPTVTDALLRAHRRGVQVRLVTDGEYEDEEMVGRLRRARVPVTVRPKDGGLMHNKFVVVDDTWVWTGSWNLTENCTYRNNNNAVLIASRHLAENYATEFEELFSGKFGPTSPKNTPYPTVMIEVPEKSLRVPVEVYFAPEDKVARHLIPVLSGARQSVRFMAFVFTSQDIADALIQLARRGIAVEGVVEDRGAEVAYGQYTRLKEAGIPVWLDGNPYILHHKVFIVDEEIVVLGSYNFSGSAEKSNDENLLILYNPEVAQAFLGEYRRVWQQAQR